jgi:anti-anti-sigma factor
VNRIVPLGCQICTTDEIYRAIALDSEWGTSLAPPWSRTTNMQELQFKMYRTGGAEVIEMVGAVDALAFTEFAATLTRVMEEVTPCIVLDCSKVTYIGSAQLKELIDFAHIAQARGGDLKCVGLPQTIQQVANLIAMGDLMEFHDHLPEALQTFRTLPVSVTQ